MDKHRLTRARDRSGCAAKLPRKVIAQTWQAMGGILIYGERVSPAVNFSFFGLNMAGLRGLPFVLLQLIKCYEGRACLFCFCLFVWL